MDLSIVIPVYNEQENIYTLHNNLINKTEIKNYLNSAYIWSNITKMKLRIIIEQDEDGMFISECPTLPGCISQGKTRKEALENIKDAIKGYLESLKKHNEPIPPTIDEEVVEINA